MDAARSAGVAPSASSRVEPSGRETFIAARILVTPWGTASSIGMCGVDGDSAPIVEGFSARIPADGLTAMVGASGSGKTTLLRLLNRLDDPDAGEVLFEGRDVRSYDVLELRRRVQYVGQVPVTFPGTVADNVGPETPAAARPGRSRRRPGRPRSRPASVGEAQRMCLARALARHPECLLLDEPTSALDTTAKAGIEALIRSLADDGLTVVMVTHDPRQANELADRTLRWGRCERSERAHLVGRRRAGAAPGRRGRGHLPDAAHRVGARHRRRHLSFLRPAPGHRLRARLRARRQLGPDTAGPAGHGRDRHPHLRRPGQVGARRLLDRRHLRFGRRRRDPGRAARCSGSCPPRPGPPSRSAR